MNDIINTEKFLEEVIQNSHVIFYHKNAGDINNALPDKGSGEKLSDDVKNVQDVLKKSEKALTNSYILEKLCPALSSVGDSLGNICNTVVGVLIPMIIAKQVDLPINSMLFGGIAVTLFTSSIKTICNKHLK